MNDFQLQRVPKTFVVEKLPDGSTAVFEPATKAVHALNPVAAAVFEACREKIDVARLIEAIGAPGAEDAIFELESAGLVRRSGAGEPSRRGVFKVVGLAAGVAVPMVLSLTAADQRAYVGYAYSVVTKATPPVEPPTQMG